MRRFRPALLASLLAVLLLPTASSAHAQVVRLDPAPGLLPAAPSTVSIEFSEPVTAFGRGIDIFAPSGKRVSGAATRSGSGGTVLVASITDQPSLTEGTYLVQWRVLAQDTHPSRGSYTFDVGHPGSVPAGDLGGGDLGAVSPPGLLLQALARWLHLLGFALSFGVLAFVLIVLREIEPPARLRRLVYLGIALLLVAEPIALVAQAASLGKVDSPSVAEVLGSAYGRVLALRLAAALALWGILGIPPGSRRRGTWAALALGVLLALVDGLSGHTIRGLPPAAGVLLTAVHVASMVVWVGGFAALVVIGTLSDPRALLARFGRIAGASVAVLFLSGGMLALFHLDTPAQLWLSSYGIVLAVKLAAVVVLLWLAWTGLRARRSGRPELLALAGVLALAALLASLPPPR